MARLGLLWHVLQLEPVRIWVRSDYHVLPVLLQLVLLMWRWVEGLLIVALAGVACLAVLLWMFDSL